MSDNNAPPVNTVQGEILRIVLSDKDDIDKAHAIFDLVTPEFAQRKVEYLKELGQWHLRKSWNGNAWKDRGGGPQS